MQKELLELKNKWNNLSLKKKKAIAGALFAAFMSMGCGFDEKVEAPIEETIQVVELPGISDSIIEYETIEHVVKNGENLTKIALMYDVPIQEIVEDNDLSDPNKIEIDQVLIIKKPNYHVENTPTPIPTVEENRVIVEPTEAIKPLTNVTYEDPFGWNAKLASQGYVNGIDISKHQSDMDLDKVLKTNDIDFVMLRVAYFFKENDPMDHEFEKFARICHSNGVPFGIYYWPTCESIDKSQKEVEIIINKLNALRSEGIYLDMPVCLDIERENGGKVVANLERKNPTTLAVLQYTINALQAEGYYVQIYSNNEVSTSLANTYHDLNVDMWVARYSSEKIDYPYFSTMRQYTQTGRLNNYSRGVDLDKCYYNLPRIIRTNGLNHYEKPEEVNLNR